MNVLAISAFLAFSTSAASGADKIRISLFSLFKPEVIEVKIASGEGARLDAAEPTGNRAVRRGEVIRIRLSGNRLRILVRDSLGRLQHPTVASQVQILPASSATLELALPGRLRREVRGALSIDAGPGGRGPLGIVLVTDREAAVASIVGAETSRRELEALTALGVIVRTYMLAHPGRHSEEGFDFCDNTHCQLYRGEQDLSDGASSPAVADAVARTVGLVLRFKGRTVEGFYSAACGGYSATPSMVWGGTSEYPYSRIVCRWCAFSKFATWKRSASAADVIAALSSIISSNLSSATELTTDSDQQSGFVRSVTVRDGSRRVVLTTDAFRRAVGLKLGWNTVLSPTFTVERRGRSFIFRGRGFGNQIGLCEAGASAQAAAGRSYREILKFYYPGADLSEQPAP